MGRDAFKRYMPHNICRQHGRRITIDQVRERVFGRREFSGYSGVAR